MKSFITHILDKSLQTVISSINQVFSLVCLIYSHHVSQPSLLLLLSSLFFNTFYSSDGRKKETFLINLSFGKHFSSSVCLSTCNMCSTKPQFCYVTLFFIFYCINVIKCIRIRMTNLNITVKHAFMIQTLI